MQTIKITIRGEFWDTQLYKGTLYLFDIEGTVQLIDWLSLLDGFAIPDRCRLAMECAFSRSDYLYGDKWERLFKDQEIQSLLESKFAHLLQMNLELDTQRLAPFIKTRGDSPFPYAHNDSLFYKDYLYAVSQSGVYSQFMTGEHLSTNQATRTWDAPVSALDVNLDVLALAAGDEGLYRAPSATYFQTGSSAQPKEEQVTSYLCNDCNYVRSSILSSAHDIGATLSEFRPPKRRAEQSENDLSHEYWEMKSINEIDGESLFDESTAGSFCWGSKDRLSMAKDGVLITMKYVPFSLRRRNLTLPVRTISLSPWKGSPVSGDNAVFGAILELDNALVVVRSDEAVETFPGEPVNWRVFPRSKYYTNQLHIIYDDRIEILSFNHDYFVEQSKKPFGEPYIASWNGKKR